MARGMHRHRSIRRENLAATKIETRRENTPSKIKARVRREARILAKIKATPAGTAYSGEVQSWLSRHFEKPASKITSTEVASLLK